MGSGIVEVSLGGTGGWVADMASPTLDNGSTVAYVLVAKEERKTGRVYASRRDVEGRRIAIVGVVPIVPVEGERNKKEQLSRRKDISGKLKILVSISGYRCQKVRRSECQNVKCQCFIHDDRRMANPDNAGNKERLMSRAS